MFLIREKARICSDQPGFCNAYSNVQKGEQLEQCRLASRSFRKPSQSQRDQRRNLDDCRTRIKDDGKVETGGLKMVV